MILVLACAAAVALATIDVPSQAPTLVVVLPSNDDFDAGISRRFARELGLVVDAFKVTPVELDRRGFFALPLNEEVQLLRAEMPEDGAAAAVWLSRAGDLVLLHFLAREGNRVEVRTATTPYAAGAEKTFALMVRELLTGGYLRVAGGDHATWARVVGDRDPTVHAELVEARAERPLHGVAWSFKVGISGAQSFIDTIGPQTMGGVGVGGERRLGTHLRLGAWASAELTPRRNVDDGEAGWLTLALGPSLAYAVRVGDGSLAPRLAFQGSWTRFALQLGSGPDEAYGRWNGTMLLGLEWRSGFLGSVALSVAPEIGWNVVEHSFARLSDRELVFRSSRAVMRVVLAVHIPGT